MFITAKKDKWMQKAAPKGKDVGKLHRHFGIPEDETIPVGKIKAEIKRLQNKRDKSKEKKFSKDDLKLFRELQFALRAHKKSELVDLIVKSANRLDSIGMKKDADVMDIVLSYVTAADGFLKTADDDDEDEKESPNVDVGGVINTARTVSNLMEGAGEAGGVGEAAAGVGEASESAAGLGEAVGALGEIAAASRKLPEAGGKCVGLGLGVGKPPLHRNRRNRRIRSVIVHPAYNLPPGQDNNQQGQPSQQQNTNSQDTQQQNTNSQQPKQQQTPGQQPDNKPAGSVGSV